MSEALIWHLIRDNNSFMIKRERTSRRGATQFSSEPGNLLNAHCFKYSGLANNSTIDISSGLKLTVKDSKVLNKPSKAYTTQTLSQTFPSKVVSKTLEAVSANRPDLTAAAKIRALKISRAVKGRGNKQVAKKVVKATRRSNKSK